MHTKRINRLGQIVIPKEISHLKEGDSVDILHNEQQIIIEPHKQRYVCTMNGKAMSEAIRIGKA